MAASSRTSVGLVGALLAAAVLISKGSCQNSASGCGGFVRSKKDIDFSRIEMELLTETPSGGWRRVGRTDCAPNNGYYFLPVERPGSYRLKAVPPRGWKISPEDVLLEIDGKTDPCSANRDLDFEFVGFGIAGSVRSKGSAASKAATGPSGVSIELLSADDKAVPLQSTETDGGGGYLFFGVLPGRYVIRVGDAARNAYSFDKPSLEVNVGDDVGACEPFFIDGYSLTGTVSTASGAKLDGVAFVLRRGEGGGNAAVAKVKSDSEGRIKFSNVAIGTYEVTAVDGEGLVFRERRTEVRVGHEHVEMPSFVVTSFSLAGSVLSSEASKRPLAGVSLKVAGGSGGGGYEATTDAGGRFAFDGVTSSEDLVARAFLDGYDFESVALRSPSPRKELGPIFPARYRLSGSVDRSSVPPGLELKVRFASESDPDAVGGKVLVTEKGTFSIYLPAGAYVVAVEIKPEQRGVGFAPVQREVAVVDGPIKSIDFAPVKAVVRGSVKLLLAAEEGPPLEVNLSSAEGSFELLKKRPVDVSNGRFEFSDVLPGNYVLSISESGNRCWSKPVVELTVSQDVDGVVFQQIGFYVQVSSSHPTLLKIERSAAGRGPPKEVAVEKGSTTICVESSGEGADERVEFSTRGCERFDAVPPSLVPSRQLQRVVLKPTHFEVSGRILCGSAVPKLELHVESGLRKREEVKVARDDRGYSFSLDGLPGEELTFTPQSEEFLFDPDVIHVFVDRSCHQEAVHFEAVSGFFIRGQIEPPVAGAVVEIVNLPAAHSASSKRASSVSDGGGAFRLGPLPAEEEESGAYEIRARKEGYVFEEVEGRRGRFRSRKLAAISVSVANDDDGGKPLAGAVVSVSGGAAYRSNTHTGSGGGASFLSLSPGEYFVKPQLKEFEFEPKHRLQDVKEGETSTLRFVARRVAFSAFGRVVSLNGEPDAGVTLRAKGTEPARCADGGSEEATSERNGEFRFRGLVPGCRYSITLREEGRGDVEKIIPREVAIEMGERDMTLPSAVVAVRSVEIMDVTLRVDDADNPGSEASVKVVMSDEAGSYSYVVKRVVGQLVTLPAVPKDDAKKYSIVAETYPEKYAPKRRAVAEFRADQYYRFVNVTLEEPLSSMGGGGGGGPKRPSALKLAFFVALLLVGLVAYFARDRVLSWLNYLREVNNQRKNVAAEDAAAALGVPAAAAAGGMRKRTKKRLA